MARIPQPGRTVHRLGSLPPMLTNDAADLGTVYLFIDYRNHCCSILEKKGLLREGAAEG
jgi:hypothetical protein